MDIKVRTTVIKGDNRNFIRLKLDLILGASQERGNLGLLLLDTQVMSETTIF